MPWPGFYSGISPSTARFVYVIFVRTTRKTAEDEGRRRGRLGNDAKHIQALRAWLRSGCPSGTKAIAHRSASHYLSAYACGCCILASHFCLWQTMSPIRSGCFGAAKAAHSARVILFIPKSKAIPWKIVWEKLSEWGQFLGNENRINRSGQTQSSEGRRNQVGGSVQSANAEIQSGGHYIGIDRPSDIGRIFINILVSFSKITMKKSFHPTHWFRIYLHRKGYRYRRSDNQGFAGKGAFIW